MPRKEDEQPIADPIVLAAMVEDEDETEEEKAAREEITKEVTGDAPSNDDEDDDDTSDEDDDDADDDEEDDEEAEGKKSKPKKKPVEAEDDTEDDVDEDLEEDDEEDDPKPKKSRKQRRAERQEDFLTSVQRDTKPRQRQKVPEYNPLNYEVQPKDQDGNEREYTTEELADDRERVAATQFARGAQTARYWAEQDQFWRDLDSEANILKYDPNLSFLSEETPDGKKNENFNPDKTQEINESYLQFVGFKQYPKRDQQGRILVDQNGNPIISHSTVDRTDISYEKYAKRYVNNMKKWAAEEAEGAVEEDRTRTSKARKNRSVRPTSSKRRKLGELKPGDISRMTDEELEKNEDEIDRQIDAMLGI